MFKMKLSVDTTVPPEFYEESAFGRETIDEFIYGACENQLGYALIEKMKNEGAISTEMFMVKLGMSPMPTLRMSIDCVYGEEYRELKNKLIEKDNRIEELEYAFETLSDEHRKNLEILNKKD